MGLAATSQISWRLSATEGELEKVKSNIAKLTGGPMISSRPSSIDEDSVYYATDYVSVAVQLPPSRGVPIIPAATRKLRHVTGFSFRGLTIGSVGSDPSDDGDGSTILTNHRASIPEKDDPNQTFDSMNLSLSSPSPVRRRSRVAGSWAAEFSAPSNHLVDSMIACYTSGQDDPIYISEPISENDNPSYKEVDFKLLTMRNNCDLRVVAYGRHASSREPIVKFLEKSFKLSSLLFIGRTFDSISFAFPRNSLIISLHDGCYALEEDLFKSELTQIQSIPSRGASPIPIVSTSFGSIMKIQNLQNCIGDSERTTADIESQINHHLAGSSDPAYFTLMHKYDELKFKVKRIRKLIDDQRSKKTTVENKTRSLRARIESKHALISLNRNHIPGIMDKLHDMKLTTSKNFCTVGISKDLMASEHSRISLDLSRIFPIEPVPDKTLQFKICGITLPDAIKPTDTLDEDEIDAAYGFVAQLVHMMSLYLDVPLRYPVQPYGSTSFIVDPISTIQGSRIFPLWLKGSLFYRFEYAVYLVHKNIEQLINSEGILVSDLRHTLANLKNLFLVVQSKGEKSSLRSTVKAD